MLAVTCRELAVLFLRSEERRQIVADRGYTGSLLQRLQQISVGVRCLRVLCVLRSTGRDGIGCKIREVSMLIVQLQRLAEAILETLKEKQRAAEEKDITSDLASLRQTTQSLVNNRLENGSRNIFLASTLVEQRLNIGLCENAAARSDGVNALCMQAEFVEFGRCNIEQDGHLIDERTGAAGAGTVHTLFQLTG